MANIVPNVFEIADHLDEQQALDIGEFRDVLCYKIHDKYELSYKGIKHLALAMSTRGHPLAVLKQEIELKGEGKEKTWYATVTIINKNTKHETVGNSECPFYDDQGRQDHFARTKALSKAERNALRKQIPEAMITSLLNKAVDQNKVAEIKFCTCTQPKPSLTSGICMTCSKPLKR